MSEITLSKKIEYVGYDNVSYEAIAELTVDLERGFEIYSGELSVDRYDYKSAEGEWVATEERCWPIEVVAATFDELEIVDGVLKLVAI